MIIKISSLHASNEMLTIVAEGGKMYRFEPNADQLMLLLHQITNVLFKHYKQVPRQ